MRISDWSSDVCSSDHSFSEDLQQEWRWSERFAGQPEILRYAGHVADRFDLRRDITFDTRVTRAAFDEGTGRWDVRTDRGERVSAQYCVLESGCRSAAQRPELLGIDGLGGSRCQIGKATGRERVCETGNITEGAV